MKFCLINNLYQPYSRGGAEVVVARLAEELKSRGQVLVISSQPDDILNCQTEGGYELCRVNPRNYYYLLDDNNQPVWKKVFWHLKDFNNKKVNKTLINLLRDRQSDFVFTHNLKGLSLTIPRIIKKLGLIHIHTLHDYQLLEPHGSMHRQGQNLPLIEPWYRYYRYQTRKRFNSPDLVISPSKFVLDKHLSYGFFKNSQTAVLPNPISVDENSLPEKVSSNKLRILYLGQLEKHKGAEFLVKSFLSWNMKQFQLTIAGSGSQLEELKKLALQNEWIKVLGRVERSDLPELFSRTDLLVVPSIWWENSPTVIYEAYANKVPVLASDSGGSRELVRDNKTGYIFKSGSEIDLLDKLNLAWQNKNNLDRLGQAGYELIKEFSPRNYVNKLLDLCVNLKK